jgi:hypothetical protein
MPYHVSDARCDSAGRARTDVRPAHAALFSYDLNNYLRSTTPLTGTRTVRIHIRTLSGDDPHPLAQQTPLQLTIIPNDGDNRVYDAHLEIARKTLGLSFNTSDKFEKHRQLRVLVWDWTTSELILVSRTRSHALHLCI